MYSNDLLFIAAWSRTIRSRRKRQEEEDQEAFESDRGQEYGEVVASNHVIEPIKDLSRTQLLIRIRRFVFTRHGSMMALTKSMMQNIRTKSLEKRQTCSPHNKHYSGDIADKFYGGGNILSS